MKIPKSVKIGGVTYKVVIAPDWKGKDPDGQDGELFYTEEMGNVIYIDSHLSSEGKQITLIHESLHAMNSTMNHEFLDSLANQIYQFLVENNLK